MQTQTHWQDQSKDLFGQDHAQIRHAWSRSRSALGKARASTPCSSIELLTPDSAGHDIPFWISLSLGNWLLTEDGMFCMDDSSSGMQGQMTLVLLGRPCATLWARSTLNLVSCQELFDWTVWKQDLCANEYKVWDLISKTSWSIAFMLNLIKN